MIEIGVLRWMAGGALRGPLGIGLLASLSLPLVLGLLLPDGGWGGGIILPWLYPAGLLGGASALVFLSRGGEFLARLTGGTRFRCEVAGLLAAMLLLQLPMGVGAALCRADPLDLGRTLPDIFTSDLHLAGLALLLLVPELTTSVRAFLFVSAAWLLPALLLNPSGLLSPLVLLDAGGALRHREALLPSLLSASALCLAGYLVRTAPAVRCAS